MAIGADRPGILVALAGALAEAGANLEDVSSTILRGHFASMLVVDAPEGIDPGGLERSLAEAVADLEVTVLVRAVRDEASRGAPPPTSGWPTARTVRGSWPGSPRCSPRAART